MVQPANFPTPEQSARTLRIILIALVLPVIGFSTFAMADKGIRQGGNQFMAVFGVIWAVASIVARFGVPVIISMNARKRIAEKLSEEQVHADAADQSARDNESFGELVGVFHTKTIVAAAMLEGAAFLNAYLFWNDGHVLSISVAGVLVALILTMIPTQHGIENWVEGQIAAIEQMRRI